MQFENNRAFAKSMDACDPLNTFRSQFLIPETDGKPVIYLCGNSLGLQPKTVRRSIQQQLDSWQNLAVEGWFKGETPWMDYHKDLQRLMAPIVGAKPEEVIPMNSLTVNLHLMMVSFYRPQGKRYKILMEASAFPSDQYAIESHLRYHGINPAEAIIEVNPRKGEELLRTDDILNVIKEHKTDLALILIGGVNYYTGQLFDLEAITKAGHAAGAYVGFDLAHAAGNVVLDLHNRHVDFACWCSYKYLNSGPGGISGVFIHEKHFDDASLNRFAGWWGYQQQTRFKMTKGFIPGYGAEGWQLSCSPVLLMAAHKAALRVFEQAGGIENIRIKSMQLTGYLEFIINKVNDQLTAKLFRIITPSSAEERGCQLSIIAAKHGKPIFDGLLEHGIIGDWREPDVIRISPVPLYNSFEEIYSLGEVLLAVCKKLLATD